MFGYIKNDSDGDYTFALSMRISELESKERVREMKEEAQRKKEEEERIYNRGYNDGKKANVCTCQCNCPVTTVDPL